MLKASVFPVNVDWATQAVALVPEAWIPEPLPSINACVSERLAMLVLDKTEKPVPLLAAMLSVTATETGTLDVTRLACTSRPVPLPEKTVRSMEAVTVPAEPKVSISIPFPVVSEKYELDTATVWVASASDRRIKPLPVILRTTQFSTVRDLPLLNRIPVPPPPPPSISRPFRLTESVEGAVIPMPVPLLDTEIPAKPWPWILIPLEMDSAP